jgi:hypothetical protein
MKERRDAYLRVSLRSPWAIGVMIAATVYFVVDGVAAQAWALVVGGPAVTALVIYVVAYLLARSRAATEYFSELAPQLGLSYTLRSDQVPLTPLLSAGDSRQFRHSMEGPLLGKLGGPPCMLCHYTYANRVDPDGELPITAGNSFTICAINVGMPIWRFRGLYLRPRISGLGLEDDWLARSPKPERVALESTRFNETYEVRRSSDQDESALRELFSPSFIVWLTEHPLKPGFECKAGTLVVFIRGHADTHGKFIMLLEAAREITRRLSKQVEEGGSNAPPPHLTWDHFSAAGQTIL